MTASVDQDIRIEVSTPEALFNAPPVNPFSENELQILGMSGMDYVVRQLRAHRRDWRHVRIVVRMPANQLAPAFGLRVTEAFRRYCRAKAENNMIEIRLIRLRNSFGLGILLVIVVALIAGAYLSFAGPLADVPQPVQLAVTATISLFSWVSLWDPLEALIFEPIELLRENLALHRVALLDVIVESVAQVESGTAVAGGAISPMPAQ